MKPTTPIIFAVLVTAFVMVAPWSASAQEQVQVIKAAPIFVAPDTTRTPLITAKEGTTLVALSIGKEWVEVEWQDPNWGRRVGYIQAQFVKRSAGLPAPPTPTAPPSTSKPGSSQAAPTKPAAPGQPPAAKKPVSTAGRWTDRAVFGVNGIYQGGSKAFSESFTFDQYAEVAHVTTDYPKLDGPAFDAGGGVRLWRNLAAGAAVSYFTKSGTATVNATIPHPLYLNEDRTITGPFSSSRTELAVHVQAAWVIPAGKKLLVTLAGGPSIFSVRQSLVTGVKWSESYPYDTAEFTSADSEEASKSAVGFNVGVDLAYYFSKTIGVGGLVRYATAQVRLGGKSGSLKVDAGGFQAGGGLRIRIPAGPPKKQPPKAPAAQVPDPLIGTWQLNLAKSTYSPGPAPKSETRIYEASGKGLKLLLKGVDAGGQPVLVQSTFNVDGKDYPVTGSPDVDAQALKVVDAFRVEGTLKKGGKVVQTVTRVLSKDGKVLTLTFKGTNAKGQTVHNVLVFDKR